MATETSTAGAVRSPTTGRSELAGIVLAAGLGTRLRPLTDLRPKALCPVGNVALVDAAIDRVGGVTGDVAVNVHAGREAMERHFPRAAPRAGVAPVQLSVEEPHVLGTAGALGQLRWWIDGRPALVSNGDTWCPADLAGFVGRWDGERCQVLLADDPTFGPRSQLVATLLPWSVVSRLAAEPSGLYDRCLAPADAAGRLATARTTAPFFDCGTPASYLAANLHVARDASIVAPGATVRGPVEHSVIGEATVDGRVEHSVVWSGAEVGPSERLCHAIRTDRGTTVLAR